MIPTAIEHMRKLYPESPLAVVSEFPPGDESCRWIPYHVRRTFRENLELCRASLAGHRIQLSAVILQPRMPYWRMRAIGFLLSPWRFLAFNENLGHFMLHPRSAGTMLRHFLWRARNFVVWELSPGGATYTFLWRLLHPWAFKRPLLVAAARLAGRMRRISQQPLPAVRPCPPGISVVIPTRNGRELLSESLPEVVRQIEQTTGEVIVIDNGSDDGTAAFLRDAFPSVRCIEVRQPLSFARAINAGVEAVSFSHVCLLNNDMYIERDLFSSLRRAFDAIPDLFCATAQIFMPEGARREETGKGVMPADRPPADFPVRCELPIPGEDHTYVLYGSGGCSLYDTAKLRQLGGLDPIYEPAYVEDLAIGVRAWQQNWATVFVAGARVLHRHRSTTSRYYSADELGRILEVNYLRFLVQTIVDPDTFRRMWDQAIRRLNALAARQPPVTSAQAALTQAWAVTRSAGLQTCAKVLADGEVFAIGSGEIAVFPGAPPRNKPVILIASPYLPFPLSHGGAVRMFNLMRRAAADFDQVLVSFVDELAPVPPEVLAICTEVVTVKRHGSHARPSTARPDVVEEFASPAFRAVLRQTVRKWRPGIAQLEFTQMAQYATSCSPAKTILVEHDVTLDLVQQLLALGEDWELRYQLPRWVCFEKQAWRDVDRVITMSDKDGRMIEGGHAVVLPNGVDIERFQSAPDPPEPYRLLFIGSFAHLPNVLAIGFFLREVWPKLAGLPVRLHLIAGSRHRYFLERYRDRVQVQLDQPDIEVEDFVADVRPAYQRAAIVIAPLVASAGTNIKILEAMAMGKAIVSTSAGINGLDLAPGRNVLVTDTAPEMADAIAGLLRDEPRRHEIEVQARQTVVAEFNWDAIARRQKQIYDELSRPHSNSRS